jgi:hypothetical protein
VAHETEKRSRLRGAAGAAHEERIELPAPTHWPLLAAFGVAFGFAGLVTHPIVTIVGVVCFVISGVGWWREVLPVQHEVEVPWVAPELRARPVEVARAQVEHLALGEGKHRMRLPTHVFPLASGLEGGLVGGIVMAAIAELYGLVAQGSLWYPVNLLAAAGLPSLATAPLEELVRFDAWGLGIGVLLHLSLSLLMGLLYAVLLPMLPRHPVFFGGVIAPLLWTGLVWAGLGVINPALAARIDWIWFVVSQVGFGLAAGFIVARRDKIPTLQSAPVAVRAAIEAQE